MATLPSGLTEAISDDEDLARFLTQSNQYNASMAKPAAFLPNPKDREISVSRHGLDPIEQLWAIGTVASGHRNLYGAAIFKAQVVRATRLELLADEPPPRHAVIRGWPWNDGDPEFQKARQKELALEIASRAQLIRR